ncbi:MAG TPA: imidazole glycerol phosphate synthase subunit HisH [Tepidisphaeraceae bacterium]
MIGIVDYGMANLRSVQNAFAAVGEETRVISRPAEIASVDHLVLPGVGAFRDAMVTLHDGGFIDPIKKHIDSGRPFLGICLGLQMLFDVGHEDGEHTGLGIFGGTCARMTVDHTHGLKVPHMGWNQLHIRRPSPLLSGVAENANVYFVHGYHVVPTDPSIIATTTDYGVEFVSSVWRDNVVATQFHPEKSQTVGLSLLRNFVAM